MKKQIVLDEIVKYYITSHDFNGLPLYNMKHYDYKILCELIDEGYHEQLSVESSSPFSSSNKNRAVSLKCTPNVRRKI